MSCLLNTEIRYGRMSTCPMPWRAYAAFHSLAHINYRDPAAAVQRAELHATALLFHSSFLPFCSKLGI
jgi:hypothetical protein